MGAAGIDTGRDSTVKADTDVRLHTNEFLGADPLALSQYKAFKESPFNIFTFSLTPILDLQKLVKLLYTRLMRPRLQKGYNRIEWTCVSGGDLLLK